MDVHNQQQEQYPQPDAYAQMCDLSDHYDPYYAHYPQSHYDPSVYSHCYYDYSASYHQPPPPGVNPTNHHYAATSSNEGIETATNPHSSEYAVPMNTSGDGAQGGGGRGSFGGRGGRRGCKGSFGRRNSRGHDRGRGQELAPPPPKPARQPKQHAWCDICRIDCNSVEILEQHKAGKKHKRTIQRIQEYEAQVKQLAGYQSTVIVSTATDVGLSIDVHQTSPATVAASAPSITNEAGASNPPDKGEILEEHNKESEAQNQSVTGGPSESVKTEAGGTQKSPLEEEAVPSGKQPFIKRPRPDGCGLGFMQGYYGVSRFERGGRRGGRFDRWGKRPRRFGGDFQPWTPMHMPMMPPYCMMPHMPMSGMTSPIQRVRPIVCTLCNVSCNTPAVFDTHVSGKKHQTHINRVQDPNMIFGPITVFIPPGQPMPCPQNGPEPVFYGLTTPEMIKQHEMLMRNQMEDESGEEEDAGEDVVEDVVQDRNPEERAKGDGQEEAMSNTQTNCISNAEQSKDENGLVMERTGTVCSSSKNENEGTEVVTHDNDPVPGLQITRDVAEEVTSEEVVG